MAQRVESHPMGWRDVASGRVRLVGGPSPRSEEVCVVGLVVLTLATFWKQ